MRHKLRTQCSLGFGAVLLGALITASPTQAADPDSVSFRLEGCRNDGSITLPNGSGKFICPDAAYTTGNLGKGWNELDLVPYRVTAKAGNSAPASQTYTVSITLDREDASKPGYDVISAPVLNTALSSASCTAAGSTVQTALTPGVGGIDVSIYRKITITQAKNTECVYDYYGRLALGSHLFPGSSLHANLLNESLTTAGIGSKDVSIPVREISPQELDKDMAASQNADFTWNLTKTPAPANVSFANTCDMNEPRTKSAKIRVEWTKIPAGGGLVTVVTNIYATNPASRVITVEVADTIYGNVGSGETILDTANSGQVDVPANTELKVLTHTYQAAANVTGLNDLATATYTDKITGVAVPGQSTATASAQIQDGGNPTNATAIITDSESVNGANVDFSVDSLTAGSASGAFGGGYTLGAFTTGPVGWTSVSQSGNGFVEFNKTIRVDAYTAFSNRSLDDTADLNASNGYNASANASIGISANAYVKLTIAKTIPDVLQGSETVTVMFEVKDSQDNIVWSPEITFAAGEFSKQITSDDLLPGIYTVVEKGAVPAGKFGPKDGTTQTKDLTLPTCAGTVTFNNVPLAGAATAQVKKITIPAGAEADWEFTLKGPGLPAAGITATTTGTGFVTFDNAGQAFSLQEGAYAITEVLKTDYEFVSKSGCEFTVDYPRDYGVIFQCVYTNQKYGKIIIRKFTDPAGGTGFGFTDNIVSPNNFVLNHNTQKTFSYVSAGSYAVTEDDPTPNYDLYQVSCNDTDSTTSVATRSASIALAAGETVTCDFYNRQRGTVTVKKTTNGTVDPTRSINFTVSGPGGINVSDNTFGDADGVLDFGGVKLVAGQTYKVCENPVPAGWTSYWQFPLGTIVTPYNPGASKVPPEDVGVRCYDFVAVAGGTSAFVIDNSFPGGDARTPGYWKNWNLCTGGNQSAVAAKNGGAAGGFFILEDLLPQLIGDLNVTTCSVGVLVLDKSDLNGKKRASDAAYNLATSLLAAKLNLAAGAQTCSAVQTAVVNGQALLDTLNFTGLGSYLPKPSVAGYSNAISLAGTLDAYNNNKLCP